LPLPVFVAHETHPPNELGANVLQLRTSANATAAVILHHRRRQVHEWLVLVQRLCAQKVFPHNKLRDLLLVWPPGLHEGSQQVHVRDLRVRRRRHQDKPQRRLVPPLQHLLHCQHPTLHERCVHVRGLKAREVHLERQQQRRLLQLRASYLHARQGEMLELRVPVPFRNQKDHVKRRHVFQVLDPARRNVLRLGGSQMRRLHVQGRKVLRRQRPSRRLRQVQLKRPL